MTAHIDTMAYYGDVPWHKLGTKVEQAMTAEEAIKAAGLDWRVVKRQVLFEDPKTLLPVQVPGKFVTVRTDKEKGLGVVGRRYTPFQNAEAFAFFDAIVQEKLAIYHTCGSLKDGRYIWILAKLPTQVKVLGVDPVDAYTLLWNRHDGCGSVAMRHTSVRVVCWNTLSMATGKDTNHQFNIRHMASVGQKVEVARNALGIVTRTLDDFLQAAELMARKKLNTAIVDKFLEDLKLDTKKQEDKRIKILDLIETGYGHNQPQIKHSVWTMLNAVTQYVDHNGGNRTDDKKLMSQWFGTGAKMKNKALASALTLAK